MAYDILVSAPVPFGFRSYWNLVGVGPKGFGTWLDNCSVIAAGHISDDEIIRALSKLLSQSTPGDKREPSKTNSELRRRPLQRGEHTTINLKPQEDRNVKHIGDEFSFKPRDELDDEEKSLMKDIELARQSRKICL